MKKQGDVGEKGLIRPITMRRRIRFPTVDHGEFFVSQTAGDFFYSGEPSDAVTVEDNVSLCFVLLQDG